MNAGEVRVWRVRLDELWHEALPRPTPEESAQAARFGSAEARQRYLGAHQALRVILQKAAGAPLEFAVTEKGKPYLANEPRLKFNLSRSHDVALVAVALDAEVGVDVERMRPLADCAAIAERYFPPSEWAALAERAPEDREREFFRRWTRLEAMWKAQGVGLYGAGSELRGEWSVEEIDAGPGFAAAVAAARAGLIVRVDDFGAEA